jgi:hypothetical protein
MRDHRVRVAAIVHLPMSVVGEAVARLPDVVKAYVVETGAGVLVTLERKRGLLVSRRRAIRALQRELATIGGKAAH